MPRNRPRRKNANVPGDAHELTFCCHRRFRFLASDRTCQWLADSIDAARVRHGFLLWAYVFMPDHVHLVLLPTEPSYDMGEIRRSIKEPVARLAIAFLQRQAPEWIPRITRKRGRRVERLFWMSGGGYDRNINEAATLLKMIDYAHLNPVVAGLVECATDWKWSSAAWYAGAGDSPLRIDPIPREWFL